MSIWTELLCDICSRAGAGQHGEGAGSLRRSAKRQGWRRRRGEEGAYEDLCPCCADTHLPNTSGSCRECHATITQEDQP
jgi:hypothetical protein